MLFDVAGEDPDTRFSNWAKEVVDIAQANNGYAFVGSWVPQGTVEIERRAAVYLVATTHGSRKHQTTTYRIVRMTEVGEWVRTDITTDDRTPGWALRIRDQVRGLL